MKIEKIKEKQSFKPFKIEITFESQKEVDLLKELLKYDCSIPEAVSGVGSWEYIKIQSAMIALQRVMIEE